MAIDSRDKRASAICVGLPWRVYPNPDGSLAAQADRQHMGLAYRGILASALTIVNYPIGLVKGKVYLGGVQQGRTYVGGAQKGKAFIGGVQKGAVADGGN